MATTKPDIPTPGLSIDELRSKYEELIQLKRKLSTRISDLELLLEMNDLLSGSLDKEETLGVIRSFLSSRLKGERYSLLIRTKPEHFSETIYYPEKEWGETLTVAMDSLFSKIQQSKSWHAIHQPDLSQTEPDVSLPGLNSGSLLALPLLAKKQNAVGLFTLYRETCQAFSNSDVQRFSNMARIMAEAIDRAIQFQQTQELAFTDALTGIFNRRYFDMRYSREILRARRYRRELSVVMIDIDYFKQYNDTFGHLKGDEALKSIAELLESNLRRADIVCRYGGEEFVVVLPEINSEKAMLVAEKLRRAVSSAPIYGAESLPFQHMTISVGVSSFPQLGLSAEDVLEHADQALYAAKASGRNRVVMFGAAQ